MDHSTGLSYHPDTGVVYNSQAIFDLGHFLLRLQEPSLPSIVEHVRTLSFNLTYDNMVGSAIINILDGKASSKLLCMLQNVIVTDEQRALPTRVISTDCQATSALQRICVARS